MKDISRRKFLKNTLVSLTAVTAASLFQPIISTDKHVILSVDKDGNAVLSAETIKVDEKGNAVLK